MKKDQKLVWKLDFRVFTADRTDRGIRLADEFRGENSARIETAEKDTASANDVIAATVQKTDESGERTECQLGNWLTAAQHCGQF